MGQTRKLVALVVVAIALVLVGSAGAYLVHTSGGKVKITDMRFVTEDGARLRALLYVPDWITVAKPAPAVVSTHGYNNTAEVQDLNCVELSRRGYVVMAIDAYDHGLSSFPDPRINKGVAADMGTYAALQYLGTLPYVDRNRIGMVGHSMGSIVSQIGAARAYRNHDKNPSIVVPRAVVATSHTYLMGKDGLAYANDPLNVAIVFGRYDEWADNMWKVPRGSDINRSKNGIAGMGFAGAEFDSYYVFRDAKKLAREEAVAAAAAGKPLRVMYQPQTEHPKIHLSTVAVASILDFFDVTLKDGRETLARTDQVWPWKQFFTGLALVGFFLFIVPFAFLLLQIPYFRSIVQPEPVAPTAITTPGSKVLYWALFVLLALPGPLLYNWATGYPIGIKSMNRYVPTVFPLGDYFQLPAVNGVVLLVLIVGAILLAAFVLTYQLYMKRHGVTFADLGIRISGSNLVKSALLALLTFLGAYLLLVVADFFFLSDARFWVFSVKTLTPVKFWVLLKYLPIFLWFYVIVSLLLNSFTRIRGASEWANVALMIVALAGGYYVLTAVDYGALFTTGVKFWPDVPFPPKMTSALAGVLLWNLEFILPLAAISSRLFFKRTGSIWTGAFVNALVVTLFAISNTVASAGTL